MQTLQIVSNDALRSSIQSVLNTVLNIDKVMNIMKCSCMCLGHGLCRVESSRQPFWILVDEKIVSVGKEHTTYVIFPINS